MFCIGNQYMPLFLKTSTAQKSYTWVEREYEKNGNDSQNVHTFVRRHTPNTLHIYTPLHIHAYTHCANTSCAAWEDHSISIHDKSGLPFFSQPNLASRSPSALPSAGLSAACLEVNSFMIPLSVLPIFKWLILPLWQRLTGLMEQPPPFRFQHHPGHHQDNNPRLLPDMRYQTGIDFTKRAATT